MLIIKILLWSMLIYTLLIWISALTTYLKTMDERDERDLEDDRRSMNGHTIYALIVSMILIIILVYLD